MAKYLFNCLNDVRGPLQSANRLVLFLDFDGTLAPIAPAPGMASLSPDMREILKCLAGDEHCALAIVSGRSLEDVKRLVKVPGIIYAGNHGLEISGPGLEFVHSDAIDRSTLISTVCRTLKRRLRPIQGAVVEMKNLTATVHYRLATASDILRVRAATEKAILPLQGRLRITDGRMAIEIRPALDWNKGSAVRWILNQLAGDGAYPIYIGDDRTDEDAFNALPNGLTVHVGPELNNTAARYSLKSPYGVFAFLEYLRLMKQAQADASAAAAVTAAI